MAVTVFSAARLICSAGNWKVTNLQLQKILYMAHMVHLGRKDTRGQPLINDVFEAWDFGPVQPRLYHKVKLFADKSVQDIFFSAPPINRSTEGDILVETCDRLLDKTPAQLVAMTHWERGAWAKYYRPGATGIVIPDRAIIDEYDIRAA